MNEPDTVERPLVGVAVIVIRDGQVLLGKRKSAHGAGTWALPGGHLEFFETIEDCAKREVAEETGLQIANVRHFAFTDDRFEIEEKHYITLFVTAEHKAGEAVVREPEKCEGWRWFFWEDLPQPRFLPLENLLAQGLTPPGG
jgi:8-oxo-dGTP diphosphatase